MKYNYSIRCTKEQKELIQKFAKDSGLTVIDSLVKAIEQYKYIDNTDEVEIRIKDLNDKIDRAVERLRGLNMFDDK